MPATSRGAFLVMFSPVTPTPTAETLTAVYLDQFTGAVLHEPPRGARSAGDRVMDWVAPLHVGSVGGTGLKVVWLILGLSPSVLFVTGVLMWWTRVVRPQLTQS